jgi:hypothetical protein
MSEVAYTFRADTERGPGWYLVLAPSNKPVASVNVATDVLVIEQSRHGQSWRCRIELAQFLRDLTTLGQTPW